MGIVNNDWQVFQDKMLIKDEYFLGTLDNNFIPKVYVKGKIIKVKERGNLLNRIFTLFLCGKKGK